MRSFCACCSLVGCAVRACSVTVVIFIMNFGLVVDYSAHIAHHFMTHRGTPRERAANALKEMGSSVFNGAFTTALQPVSDPKCTLACKPGYDPSGTAEFVCGNAGGEENNHDERAAGRERIAQA